MRPAMVLFVCWAVGLTVARAQDAGRRLWLLNANAELTRAARAGLGPDIRLIVGADAALERCAVGDARVQQAARDQRADLVVWTCLGSERAELRVIDVADDRMLGVRPLASLSLDAARAASVVLSIKTLLAGAEQSAPRAPVADAPPTAAEAPADIAPQRAPPSPPPPQPSAARSPPPSAAQLELRAHAGAARYAGVFGLRLGAGAAWWPERGRMGLELGADAGPAAHLQTSLANVHAFDAALALRLYLRTLVGSRIQLALGTGPQLHWMRLEGELGHPSVEVSVQRVQPALGAALRIDCALGSVFSVGLLAHAGWLLRTQRYSVNDSPVLRIERLHAGLSLALGLHMR